MGLFDGIANFFTGAQDNADYNAWQGIQTDLAKSAAKGMQPWLNNPTYTPAPLNQWQTKVGEGALGFLGAMSPNYSGQALGMLGNGERALGPAGQFATVNTGDIQAIAEPLESMLNESGQRQIDRSVGKAQTDLGARAAAGGAFGGSREAVQRGMLDESRIDAVQDMASSNAATAYQMGGNIASTNAAAENARNANLANAMLRSSDFDASVLSQANNLLGDYGTRQLSAYGLLGQYGGLLQDQTQAELDAPYMTANRLYGLLSGNPPQEEASGFQTLLGFLASNAGNIGKIATGNIAGVQ